MSNEDRTALVARLVNCAAFTDMLVAPCVFCGYSGAGYYQSGTHAGDCPWHGVGGEGPRKAVVRHHVRERLAVALSAPPPGWHTRHPASPSNREGAAPPPAPREAVRVLAGLRAAAATACEACEAGMRLSESSLHYHDGPGYKGSQSGDTWGVCRKVVAALRAEGEGAAP